MLGAIIGDIAGSRFEWNNIKTKRFELCQTSGCNCRRQTNIRRPVDFKSKPICLTDGCQSDNAIKIRFCVNI